MPSDKQNRRPPERPEMSPEEVQDRVWSHPGGDELALREAKTGVDADVDNRSEEVAEETPKRTLDKISDPAAKKSVLGPDSMAGSENAGKNEGLGEGGRFSERGDKQR